MPCELGGVSLDVPHWGVWRGRIYAWRAGPDIRSVLARQMDPPLFPVPMRTMRADLTFEDFRPGDTLRTTATIESLERFQSDVHLHGRCVAVKA